MAIAYPPHLLLLLLWRLFLLPIVFPGMGRRSKSHQLLLVRNGSRSRRRRANVVAAVAVNGKRVERDIRVTTTPVVAVAVALVRVSGAVGSVLSGAVKMKSRAATGAPPPAASAMPSRRPSPFWTWMGGHAGESEGEGMRRKTTRRTWWWWWW